MLNEVVRGPPPKLLIVPQNPKSQSSQQKHQAAGEPRGLPAKQGKPGRWKQHDGGEPGRVNLRIHRDTDDQPYCRSDQRLAMKPAGNDFAARSSSIAYRGSGTQERRLGYHDPV